MGFLFCDTVGIDKTTYVRHDPHMTKPTIKKMGDAVWGVRLEGNPENPEKPYFRVCFPGGDIDISRTTNGEYWIHLRVDRPESGMHIAGETKTAHITDARLDAHGKHASEMDQGDFNDPNLYHVALRVKLDDVPNGPF